MPEKEEVQVITADPAPSEDATAIGTDEFVKKLLDEFQNNKVWRRLASVAEALHVDSAHLQSWLDTTPGFMRKTGKEDGVLFYCLEDRYNKEIVKHNTKEEKKKPQRPAVIEEYRYALMGLHMIYGDFHKVLKTYSLEISQKDQEAFNFFAVALDKLESGLVLFAKKSGASVEKLPKF